MSAVVDEEAVVVQLAGRRTLLVTHGLSIGAAIAAGLRRHGAEVVEVTGAWVDAPASRGPADLIVLACANGEALKVRGLDSLSAADWREAVHRSMLITVQCLQAAHAMQHESGGSVVIVGPSGALVGSDSLVPLMTLAEGQRSLMKSAARQWGRHGMRLNWVGVAAHYYAESLTGAPVPPTPELGPPPPALGRRPEPQADIADVIAWLGSHGARGITGASFNLDGGDWMVP